MSIYDDEPYIEIDEDGSPKQLVNIPVPPVPGGNPGNTKRISPAKNWCFTLNNYTELEMNIMDPILKEYCDVAFYSKEHGANTGTPHLQGFLRFKTKRRPKSVFNQVDRIHFIKAKGSLEDNMAYCSKEAEFSFRLGVPRVPRIYSYTDLFPEQRALVDYLQTEPDERTICVVSGGYGCGKTSVARHLMWYERALILCTTRRHSLAVVLQNQDRSIFMFDLSAEFSSEPTSEFFELLEELKNGIFCSGFMKHTAPCLIAHPHIVIFSNYKPDGWCTEMDKKRFKVFEL